MSQEYEAKLVELEAALVHQLKTDTAVEKLEAQRQVKGIPGGASVGRGCWEGLVMGWGCGEVRGTGTGGTETGNELWEGLPGGAHVGRGCSEELVWGGAVEKLDR